MFYVRWYENRFFAKEQNYNLLKDSAFFVLRLYCIVVLSFHFMNVILVSNVSIRKKCWAMFIDSIIMKLEFIRLKIYLLRVDSVIH